VRSIAKELKKKEEPAFGAFAAFWEGVEKEYGPEVVSRTPTKMEVLKYKLMKAQSKLQEKVAKALTKETEESFPWILKAFVGFLLVFQAFYPKTVESIFWILLVAFIILIAVTVIITIYTSGAATLFAGKILLNVIISVAAVLLIVLLARMYPSPNYGEWLSKKWGRLAEIAPFILAISAVLLLIPNSPLGFFIGISGFWILLNMVGPYLLHSLSPAGFCIPIPNLEDKWLGQLGFIQKLKCEGSPTKETFIYYQKPVDIPVSGGIYVSFGPEGKPYPIIAGSDYQQPFTIQNLYEEDITIDDFEPWILSYYKNGILFVPTYKINLEKYTLSPNEKLQGMLFYSKDNLEPKALNPCKFTLDQIKRNAQYTGIDPDKVPCAFDYCNDSFCDCKRSACVETDNFVCSCANLLDVTCSGEPIYLAANITHTGFFVGNISLYYSEKDSPEPPPPHFMQGPISVTLSFSPPVYIRSYYEKYMNTVQLLADIEIKNGYNFRIERIDVEPMLTTISTTDYEHNIQINETIGIQKKDCIGIQKAKDALNEGMNRWNGVLCNFTSPQVTLIVKNLGTGETIKVTGINYNQLLDYCNGTLENAKDVSNILGGSSGLCSLLSNTTVEHALEFTQVIFRMDYIITETFYSPAIKPVRTSVACLTKNIS